jgi:short-subunit dehydrogenase
MASFFPGPFMNTYFASKAYVLSFSLALREEVASQGVQVSCLCPGPTRTNFGKRAHYDPVLDRGYSMDAKDVALEAYRGLLSGKAIIVPGWKNKLLLRLGLLIPKTMMARIVRWASGY